MRRPEIARLITSCWISLVPSKIVWITLSVSSDASSCRAVLLTRDDSNAPFHPVSPFPPVSGDKTRGEASFGPELSHFDFATSLVI